MKARGAVQDASRWPASGAAIGRWRDRAAAAAVAGEDRASASEKDRPFASEEGDTRSGSKPMLVSGSRPRSLFRRTIDRIASGESPVVVYAETQDRVSRVLAAYRERDGRP